MKFKVGDRVRVLDSAKRYNPPHVGQTGPITKIESCYAWVDLGGKFPRSFYDDDLILVESQPSEFKVGDRVKVIANYGTDQYSDTIGMTGKIFEIIEDQKGFTHRSVMDQGGRILRFQPREIVLLSSQSPQPQTTEPKEDTMKPYAVIVHDLSTSQQASISGYYTTEEEAKEAAELQVASRRSNLNIKQYFAITIVNTKTGKLVGSVVDAPPAVQWNKE